ncbi:MAG: hypothetical protein ACK559_12675, partial [bacterium]
PTGSTRGRSRGWRPGGRGGGRAWLHLNGRGRGGGRPSVAGAGAPHQPSAAAAPSPGQRGQGPEQARGGHPRRRRAADELRVPVDVAGGGEGEVVVGLGDLLAPIGAAGPGPAALLALDPVHGAVLTVGVAAGLGEAPELAIGRLPGEPV